VPSGQMSSGARRSRHASIVDVAALAGVSAATVSRSLRGHSNVSAATRQRVIEAARELSYVISPQASGLASGKTGTIGVVVPFVTRWFFANAVAGASDVLRDAGYDLLLHHLGSASARDRFFERMPLARRVDAVLTVSLPLSEEHTLALRALEMPLVTVGAAMSGLSSVRVDDVAAASSAVYHLLHQGHEKIVMIAGFDDDSDFGFASSRDRQRGFRQAMESGGLPVGAQDIVVAGAYGIEGGAQAMTDLLAGPRLPTAIVAEYDELAIGALRTLRRAGIGVPERISVVGIDDHEMSSVVELTTVAQPVREEGATAAQLLLDTVHGQLPTPVDEVLPTRLVVRGSTGSPVVQRPAG
jgi:LacI family transcriptional regulator, repressor for deo operon, udp, cdd, tsx, nupC, and nupG